MDKTKVKEFCKNHKKEMIVSGCIIAGGIVAAIVGAKLKVLNDHYISEHKALLDKFENDECIKEMIEFVGAGDRCKKGADGYVEICSDKFAEMIGDDFIVSDCNGVSKKIVSAILFTKDIEK